jgi:hypothetical protein
MAIPVFLSLSQNLEYEDVGTIRQWRFRVGALVLVAPLLISFSPEHFYLVSIPLLGFVIVLASQGVEESEVVDQQDRSPAGIAE